MEKSTLSEARHNMLTVLEMYEKKLTHLRKEESEAEKVEPAREPGTPPQSTRLARIQHEISIYLICSERLKSDIEQLDG